MHTKHMFLVFSLLGLWACGEPPTGSLPDTGHVSFKAAPLEGAHVNETVVPETPVAIEFETSVSDPTRVKIRVNGQMAGQGLTHSLILSPGTQVVEALLKSASSDKMIDSVKRTFQIRADHIATSLHPCRTQFYDGEDLMANCFPADTTNVRSYPLTASWRYAGTNVTIVNGRFNVSLTPGSPALEYCLENSARNLRACDQAVLTVQQRPRVTLKVYGVLSNGLGDISGLRAYLVNPTTCARTDSADVAADGTASFITSADSVAFAVDAIGSRRYLPLCTRNLKRAELPAVVNLPIVILNWNIVAGKYSGTNVPVSINTAESLGEDARFPDSFYEWSGAVHNTAIWPANKRPVPMAFYRGGAYGAITAQDSINYWQRISDLWKNTIGIEMYRPANFSELTGSDPRGVSGGVAVAIDPSCPCSGEGSARSLDGDLIGGLAFYKSTSLFTDDTKPTLVHETIHAANFGHTSCAWVSVMSGCFSDRAKQSSVPTATDVAYIQLFYRLGDLRRSLDVPFDPIAAALRGERAYILNVSPEHP